MIIDHNYPTYRKKRNSLDYGNQHNGAYYYSKEIVKNIIPNVKTDRNWVTVRATNLPKEIMDHSIVFIHNYCLISIPSNENTIRSHEINMSGTQISGPFAPNITEYHG